MDTPRPPPRTKWTRRVLHLVLIGHAASLSQVPAAVAGPPLDPGGAEAGPPRDSRLPPRDSRLPPGIVLVLESDSEQRLDEAVLSKVRHLSPYFLRRSGKFLIFLFYFRTSVIPPSG